MQDKPRLWAIKEVDEVESLTESELMDDGNGYFHIFPDAAECSQFIKT